MPDAKFLKCSCALCGGHIEFPVEGIGTTIPCPHCGRETELTLETPMTSSAGSSHSRKWIIAGIVILVLGLVGVVSAFVVAQRLTRKAQARAPVARASNARKAPATASSSANVINDFAVSAVAITKKPGSSLVYATGTIRNESDKQRFGVTIEIDLLDGAGAKMGVAKDYKEMVEPRTEWTFRALLVVKDVAAARVSAVREQ